MNIDSFAVSRHLKYLREHNSWIGRSNRQLYFELGKEMYDASRQIRQEAYKILLDPVNRNRPEVKLGALSRIQTAISLLADLRPELGTLADREQMDELQDAIAEKRLADRVLPSGRRVRVESARLDE